MGPALFYLFWAIIAVDVLGIVIWSTVDIIKIHRDFDRWKREAEDRRKRGKHEAPEADE